MFDPYQYPWTNTEGEPRTLGQLYIKWKNGESKNFEVGDPQAEDSGIEVILDRLFQKVLVQELAGTSSYVQVKLK